MRSAMRSKVVLAVLFVVAATIFVLSATNAGTRVREHDDYLRSRLKPHDSRAQVQASGQPGRTTSPAASGPLSERIGAAEKMFPDGINKDFGAVSEGAQLSHSFPITNIYDVPVTIAFLQVSCDCVTATAADLVLQPHQSTTIDVQLDAQRFTGPDTESVRVKIVGPDFESTCKLHVSAVTPDDPDAVDAPPIAAR